MKWAMIIKFLFLLQKHFIKRRFFPWAPGWLSQLSIRLWLKSWSHSLWVPASHRALCWQLRALSLLWILSPSLSAPTPLTLCLCLSVSQKEINIKHVFKNIYKFRGTWTAQSVKCPTLAQVMISLFRFGSGHDLMVPEFKLGIGLPAVSAERA